ncbi:MAG: hypothetical protein F6J90_17965 [Moorea sp. SIOASIH]|nr:hypothetical protein [Moorena sp. SIOASIH]NEO38112.1 hypothetical protein [Moorena sp. SIOASIH]
MKVVRLWRSVKGSLKVASCLLPLASCPPPLVRGVRGDSSCLLPSPPGRG